MRVRVQILNSDVRPRTEDIVDRYRGNVDVAAGSSLRTDPGEVFRIGHANATRHRVARQFKQVVCLTALVTAQDAPGTVHPAINATVEGVGVIDLVAALVIVGEDRHMQRELLGDAARLRITPTGVLGLAEAGTPLQPLQAMNRCGMLFFLAAGLHLDLHVVTIQGTHCRRERIARRQRIGIGDRWTEYTATAESVIV